jgi:hypothetical protein
LRSCSWGNIIESDITEGLPSPPPVESKVMACHAMHGSGSTGNNIREGDAILEVAMDNDNDLSTEFHMQGNIIERHY